MKRFKNFKTNQLKNVELRSTPQNEKRSWLSMKLSPKLETAHKRAGSPNCKHVLQEADKTQNPTSRWKYKCNFRIWYLVWCTTSLWRRKGEEESQEVEEKDDDDHEEEE